MLDSLDPDRTGIARVALTCGAFVLAGVIATEAVAMCDPESAPDRADIAAAATAIAATCDCSNAPTHGAYVKCAVQTANRTLLNRSCSGHVETRASSSACGELAYRRLLLPERERLDVQDEANHAAASRHGRRAQGKHDLS